MDIQLFPFGRAYDEAMIYGVDIDLTMWNKNKDLFKLSNSEKKRLNIILNDATDETFKDNIPKDFDVILDDGSHEPEDVQKTFELLFKNNLNKGGIYIIEDVHCGMYTQGILDYIYSLIPFVYKFNNFSECKMLSGRENIIDRINKDWRYEIKDITISRDIVIITKEIFQ